MMFWVTNRCENIAARAPRSLSPTLRYLVWWMWSRLVSRFNSPSDEGRTVGDRSDDLTRPGCRSSLHWTDGWFTPVRRQAGGVEVFLGCTWVWMMVCRLTRAAAAHGRRPNVWCDAECWGHVKWASCMQHTWLQVLRMCSRSWSPKILVCWLLPWLSYLWAPGAGLDHALQIQAKRWGR